MNINKPINVGKYDLIAIMDINAVPVIPLNPFNITYNKSELAINRSKGKVQVYVESQTKNGLEDFKKAYPGAEIRASATLEDEHNWRILGFPTMNSNIGETALDIYFKAKHEEIIQQGEAKAVKRNER